MPVKPWLSKKCKEEFKKAGVSIHECLDAHSYVLMYATNGPRSCMRIQKNIHVGDIPKAVKQLKTDTLIHYRQSAYANSPYIRGIYIRRGSKVIWRSICIKGPKQIKMMKTNQYPREFSHKNEPNKSLKSLMIKYFSSSSYGIKIPKHSFKVPQYKSVVRVCIGYEELPKKQQIVYGALDYTKPIYRETKIIKTCEPYFEFNTKRWDTRKFGDKQIATVEFF